LRPAGMKSGISGPAGRVRVQVGQGLAGADLPGRRMAASPHPAPLHQQIAGSRLQFTRERIAVRRLLEAPSKRRTCKVPR
jgi:hypothetical protein